METENKAWIPEVGKTAWTIRTEEGRYPSEIFEVAVKYLDRHSDDFVWCLSHAWGTSSYRKSSLFPTAEAALASIKVYDLEGKEVVIPRGQGESAAKRLDELWKVYEAYLESRRGGKPWGILEDRAIQISLADEAGMLNYSWETCLEMARNEGGGAANGGKSDQREGGC